MKFTRVIYPETKLLEEFIQNAGNSLKSFRYFATRPIDTIRFHLCTFLLIENDVPVAYGHLDEEGGTTWLGMAVIEKEKGKGYGRAMLQQLIKEAQKFEVKKIKLTADNDNIAAINLYKSVGFKEIAKKETFSFYQLDVSSEI